MNREEIRKICDEVLSNPKYNKVREIKNRIYLISRSKKEGVLVAEYDDNAITVLTDNFVSAVRSDRAIKDWELAYQELLTGDEEVKNIINGIRKPEYSILPHD